jgi:dipeptidyl-peptidase-4
MTPRMPRQVIPLCVALVLASFELAAQQRPLTLDDIYSPGRLVNFSGAPVRGLAWIDTARYAMPPQGSTTEWMRVDAATGDSEPLFDPAALETALAGTTSADQARRLARGRGLIFNRAFSAALVTVDDDLYLYTFGTRQLKRLTRGDGEEEEATFSPDGRLVAFVRRNNLFVVDTSSGRETALTSDGTPTVLNGRLDWVYEEEIYGRGTTRGYWWSPDSQRIAFLRIDDAPVSTFITLDDIPSETKVETWRYPRAGERNPIAKLGVVRAAGGAVKWADLSAYSPADSLLVRVNWTPDGRKVAFEVQNRTQSWLDLNVQDVSADRAQQVLHETTKFWINSEDTEPPQWLADGSFLWLSTRTGFAHLYHYKADGTLVRAVTDGKWEVRTIHGVDDAGWVYFGGTERSPIGEDVYRVRLDGSALERLSKSPGTHTATFSPGLSSYLDTWSDVTTPPQVRVHRSDGTEMRVISANRAQALTEYKLAKPEFLQVRTRDGFVMEAMMIKPPDFDPAKRYPVYQFTYAGPHTQQVRNIWGGSQYMYHQLLAQRGIIVWLCDNRSASGKGVESAWSAFKRLGEGELRDIEDGLTWLKQQPWVDATRIGIHGWSYGGFMTTYALTHSTSFAMGIAGGTLSDFRNYDTVWTERYMGLPQDNAEAYRAASPQTAARNLYGALLLIHGAIDDNVHVQNTMQLAYELQKADRPFQLMLYPKSRHGVTDPALVRHLRQLMFDFTMEHLKPGEPQPTRSSR